MKKKKLLSLKKVLPAVTFLLTTPLLILTNVKVAYASEKVEVNGVTYTYHSAKDVVEKECDSFEEYYRDYFFDEDEEEWTSKDDAIIALYNKYGGVCFAKYVVTSQNQSIKSLTIENTVNDYPVVSLYTQTESDDDDYMDYNNSITTLVLPANIIKFDGDEWRALSSLTIDENNAYYSTQDGILYDKGKTKVLSFLNASTFNMPATITNLPERFPNKLKAINVNKANKKYSSKDGVLYNKKKTQLIYYPYNKTTKKYTMPASVKSINSGVLDNHPHLQTLTLSKNLTKLSDCCNNMKKLKSVTLPKKVKTIVNSFNNCDNLKKISSIPSSCKTLTRAFESYKKKKTITIQSKKITLTIQCKADRFDTFSVKKGTVINLQIPWGSKIKSKNTKIASVSTVKNNESLVTIKANAKGTTTLYDSQDSSYKLVLKVR